MFSFHLFFPYNFYLVVFEKLESFARRIFHSLDYVVSP